MVFRNKKYPTEEALQKKHIDYADTLPQGWMSKKHFPVLSKFMLLASFMKEGSKILDVGCNSGEICLMFEQTSDCRVIGIDISRKLVNLAKGKGVNAIVADAKNLPFKDETFDYVHLSEILEHSHKPERFLVEAKRVLKKGGSIVGSTIDEEFMIKDYKETNRYCYRWDDERLHARSYNPKSLKRLLNKYFENVRVERFLSGFMWMLFKGEKYA